MSLWHRIDEGREIGEGRQQRVVALWDRFEARVSEKAKRARVEHVVWRAAARATHG